jgi:hypothetical protein
LNGVIGNNFYKGFDMKVDFNSFVRRQTADSSFTHWNISDLELLSRVDANFHKAKAGYKDGVILVSVDPEGFFSSVKLLKEGDKLTGEFKARIAGEEPRKSIQTKGDKLPAKSVDVVIYSKAVLAENNEHSTVADWEIVSINASPEVDGTPIIPETLIANHFGLSGGSATNMTPEQFEKALKISVLYWKDKAMVC